MELPTYYYVYIIQSGKDNSYYIGYTADLKSRLEKHHNSRKGYTATKKPWKLVYHEVFPDKQSARKRELEIKRQKSRIYIESLVEGANR